ncbi:hypothetical protein HYH03_001204 [Edaphochlamys debaryana]|uniref:Protein kinase domain-containing protein n=1 Tax=Edaphochlamys debaryana TaxID=47281 RepID=A0A835YF68_9CHLO|nr:hypothetical protein HYH03_001204 [Edaphochlamys debaryana]|eukprot:KAG2501421.1 hypothetical protein HYH03_001204 [Edaphochlamys debaryana]
MPTLDLASLSGVLTVPANGSVVIRNLRLTGVLLPTSPYPLPASSFVVPSALRLPPRGSAPSSASPPPPLELSNVLLSTPSCAALSIHQTLACSAAPSPNFTVTPSALVVHRYTSPAADLTNVTLVCVGRPAPYPCLASVADTGADALEAIRTMQGQAQALAASDLTPGLPPISNLYLRGHVILSESSDDDQPARLQPIALEVGRLVIAGAADGTTTLDLAGTSSLITVSLDASVQLHNLTLANPPVGPLSESPYRLLRLPLWTFSFPRMLLGSSLGPILAVEGGTVRDIPPEEMAAYFADLGYPNVEFDDPEFGSTPGPVPPALAPCFCIWAIDIFTSVRGMQDPGSAVGLLLSEVETWSTRMVMRDVRLVAATTPAAHAEAAAPAVTALSAPAPGADPLGPAACQSSPLCKLFPAGERTLANALDFKLSMVRQQTVRSLSLVELSFVNNGFADTGAFALAMPVVSVVVDPSNEELQTSEPVNKTARVERPGVIAGDPWAAVVLDLNELRNAINISGSKAALSIQYCVLVGLPSAAKGLGGGARGSTPAPAPLAPVVGPVSPGEGVGPSTELSGGPNVGGGAGAQLTAAPRAGTQGLAPSLANLTSCLWSMDFDRVNATPPEQRITDLPYVSLDSVVLLVPQPELALLAWAWALGSRAGGAEEAAAALAAVTSNAGLAGELAAMALRSRLEPDSAAAALVAATIASSSLSTPDTALGAFAATTSVTFATLSWCGLVGRNVTLASQLPPSLIDLALTGGLAPERLQPPALGLPWAALQPCGELGRGAQGVVYRGTWRGLPVAVKSMLLQCDGGGGRERVRRAIQEAAISASVSQPHVVATYTHLLQRMGAEDGFGPSSAPAPATGSDLQLSSDTRSSRILATQQGAELQVWKLTLVQELCDATSVRVCLDNGALARCRSVPQQPAPQPSVRILRIPGSSCSGGATSGACSTASNDWAPVVLPAMQRASPPEEPVPPSEGLLYPRVALSVALHAARGLAHLHSLGIVHGDVSSSNILLQSARPRQLPAPTSMSGAAGAATAGQPGSAGLGAERDAHGFGYVAKVCDFGSSGRLDAAGEQTHLTGPARRSSAYSAPELVRSGHAGPSGDVYALALVAWELAWGASLPSLLSRPEGSGLQAWLTQQALADPAEATALPPGLLPWPPHLPPALPELAAACLREAAAERPKMAEVCQRLEGMLG